MLKWIGWNQPGEDCRPLCDPPAKEVLGWWKTGESMDGGYSTLCAMVVAESDSQAKGIITIDWPEAGNGPDADWRFCNDADNTDLSSRFPPPDWSVERIAAFNAG